MTTRRREKEKTAVLFHHASVTPLRRKPNDVCTISFSTSFSSSANSALLLVLVVQSQSLLSQKQGKLELSERLKLFMEFLKHPNIFENKPWGTSTVSAETLNDLKDKKVHLLHELNDADVFDDINEHPAFQHFLN